MMPKFDAVEVHVIKLKDKKNISLYTDEDDGGMGELSANVTSAAQQEDKEAAARDIWLRALHKAAPALVCHRYFKHCHRYFKHCHRYLKHCNRYLTVHFRGQADAPTVRHIGTKHGSLRMVVHISRRRSLSHALRPLSH
jgi:hypothetical protein